MNFKYALIILFFITSPVSQSWASKNCDTNVTVMNEDMAVKGRQIGDSVSEALKDYKNNDPFKVFAKSTETALLKIVKENLCIKGTSENPIHIRLRFIKLKLVATKTEIEQFQAKLTRTSGSYATVSIYQENRFVEVIVVWNPRRMMRDQFILSGWKFNNEMPLPPFLKSDLESRIKISKLGGIGAPTFGDSHQKQYSLDISSELRFLHQMVAFELYYRNKNTLETPSHEILIHSLPDWTEQATRNLIKYSHLGYAAMTKKAVELAFNPNDTRPLTKVNDIKLANGRNYYIYPWSN